MSTYRDHLIASSVAKVRARYGIAKERERNGGERADFEAILEAETVTERSFYGEEYAEEVRMALRARNEAKEQSRGWDRRRMRDPNKYPRY